MKTRLFLLSVIIMLAVLSACKDDKNNKDVKEIKLTAKQQEIAVAGNEFSLGLFQKVAESETEDNFMISPLSINYAMAMTTNGAKNNTLNQMLAAMGFTDFSLSEFNNYFGYVMDELVGLDQNVNLSVANSIWYRNGFTVLPEFLDINQQYYDAEITALNFDSPDAVNTINNWVSEATNNKIPTIIESISADVVMYLINAVYFHGTWKYEFDQSQTQTQNFYLQNSQAIETEMMKMEAELKFYYDADISMVELPYGNGDFVMDIILPSSENSAADIVTDLDNERFTEITQGLANNNIVLSMPKFKFSFENSLIPALQSLGMSDLFIEGVADLSGINGDGGLFVSDVKHKTYIDVNEAGTEAAAVTSVEVGTTSVDPNAPLYLNVDHPFIFVIRETGTGIILFTGVVRNPEQE